jgi:signal transduction histidine kinase/DNA-binding response OmpR family regulator/ligand-binding sensor domain-containing protein
MNKFKSIIVVFFVIFFLSNTRAQNISFKYLGLKEGLSQMSVVSIWSDEMDVMWFATRRGINYYDGNRILPLTMTTTDGRVEHFDRARFICGDRNGIIYFVSDEELVQYNRKFNKFSSLGKTITSLAHQQNQLWAARKQTILYLDKQSNSLKPYVDLKNISNSNIRTILESTNGQLYIGSDDGFINVDKKKNGRVIIPNIAVNTFFEDNKRNIWIGAKSGLYKMSPDKQISYYAKKEGDSNTLLSNDVRAITQDKDGYIWLGTNAGINKLDPATQIFTPYTPNENNITSLSHPSVYSIYCDKQGTIWIGTFYGGVNYFNLQNEIFKYPFNDIARFRKSYAIDVICPINSEEVFITSSTLGTFRYNTRTNQYKPIPFPLKNLHLLSFFHDTKSNLIYCGTISNGVIIYDATRNYFLPQNINTSNTCLPSNSIVGLTFSENTLYIATPKGYIVYNTINKSSSPMFSQISDSTSVPSRMMTDAKGRLWMLFLGPEVVCYYPKTKQSKIHHELQATYPLEQSIRTNTIFEDNNHRIWIATSGKGLCKYNEKTAKFEVFANESSGLNSNYCFDIKQGINGDLVAFESNGITFIDVENKKFSHLLGERFLSDKIMNEGCGYYADNNGNILAGTIQGFVAFNQELLSKDIPQSNLFFSQLLVNSEEVLPNDETGILQESLPYVKSLELSSKNKSFDILYSITNYLKIGNFNTEYMLEGFDKQWIKTNSNRIHYTNLSSGDYKLKVRIRNESGICKEITLPVKIYPPFYASIWAIILYLILSGIILFYTIRFFNSRHLLMLSLDYEQREKLRIEELNQAKVRFYINVSHEFRTPISLIMAQIELLLNNHPDLNIQVKKAIQRMYKNADKLQNLVTEVLDFRKQELGKMKLALSTVNVVDLLTDIVDSFQERAIIQNQEIKYISSEKEISLFIDRNLFSKAIYNLVSNACKFTPQEGIITVSCEQFQNKVTITISDNGVGIPIEDLPNVFERFYQASNSTSGEGSGIGLSYVKEIVELHGGLIQAKNNENNSGCTFTIVMDQKKSAGIMFKTQNEENDSFVNINSFTTDETLYDNIIVDETSERNTILIVEDNNEMLNLLTEVFTPIYNVQTAKDGSEALDLLKMLHPDIILSDVMMSKVSGLELCTQIKNNYDTCHIPVVLLTAQSLEASTIEGLQTGADDYITKPFNARILIMRCNNLVNTRRVLQDKFAKQAEFSPKIIATNPNDIIFMNKAYKVIEANFENQNFDVDMFCSEMAMSRVKLYSKMKGVSGLTPKDFIQNVKLKKAADLLINRPDLLIADITYKLGFSSPRYFSKSFKELFGIIPTEYREKNKGQ